MSDVNIPALLARVDKLATVAERRARSAENYTTAAQEAFSLDAHALRAVVAHVRSLHEERTAWRALLDQERRAMARVVAERDIACGALKEIGRVARACHCEMQGRLVDSEARRAHRVLLAISDHADIALAAPASGTEAG